MENLNKCPLCENPGIEKVLQGKDHFLTHEEFGIYECASCGGWFTNPRPDSTEIGMYYSSVDYISHNTRKNDLLTRVYRIIRNYRIGQKFNLIRRYSDGKKLLDIGCGTGEFIAYVKRKGWVTAGIEPGTSARQFATGFLKQEVWPEEYLSKIADSCYDVVTMWHVLEHVFNPPERIREIQRILKPGGFAIIAVPNRSSWDAIHYGAEWAAYDLPRHLIHFNRDSLTRLFSADKFFLEAVHPMKLDAFYISMLSEKYRTGRTNYFRAFFNGIKSNQFAKKHQGDYSSIILILRNGKNEK
jgi:2-polyprenyl-3-methyl-5-hydroxy-6-metoxy-1,4-benzoquinol methylase